MDLQINPEHLKLFLQQNDLLIVSKQAYEEKTDFAAYRLQRLQAKMLRKKMLTFKEVVDAKLLPSLSSKSAIDHWVKSGRIKSYEILRDENDVKYILTSAIKRLNPNL